MIAARLRPYYEARAKERQRESGGDVRNKTVVEKIPQPAQAKARDDAGKAAGVNGRYVDMATQIATVDARLGAAGSTDRPW